MYSIEGEGTVEKAPEYLISTAQMSLLPAQDQFEAIGQLSDKGAEGLAEIELHYTSVIRMEKTPEWITMIWNQLKPDGETDITLANKISDLKTKLKTAIRAKYERPEDAEARLRDLENNS